MDNRKKRSLDFLVIGAQKSGTTSLHMYLRRHPAIYTPPEKEAPFFSDDKRYSAGLDKYLMDFYSQAPRDRLWGKVCTYYMCDSRVPARINKYFEKIKLIAILRNPIDRAYSHYMMSKKRGLETLSFDRAIEQLLNEELLRNTREAPYDYRREKFCYITWGEYGRILDRYAKYFPKDQMLLLFSDDLMNRPEDVLDSILSFLGLDKGWRPHNLSKRYHVGGTSYLYPRAYRFLTKSVLLKLMPGRLRRRTLFWTEIFMTSPDKSREISQETRAQLREHYKPDIRLLEEILGKSVPWTEFHTDS